MTPSFETRLADDLGLDPYEIDNLTKLLDHEGIPEHARDYAAHQAAQMHRTGKRINNPAGFIVSIARKHSTDQTTPTAAGKENQLQSHRHGFDFWLGNPKQSAQTCENIIQGYESDDQEKVAQAISLMRQCAPCLDSDQLATEALEAALDLDQSRGIGGNNNIRLANGTRHALGLTYQLAAPQYTRTKCLSGEKKEM